MTDQVPTVFGGRYELHRRIARGGMAEVYLARDQLLDRHVAVKVLFAEFAADPTFVERFRREAKAAANLNHPNIVGIFDWGEEDGTYYIVMEYVEGRSLAQILSERGKLDASRSADIASEVAAALGAAHRRGLAHRDVKPGNVIISNSGEVKVADFGIATALVGGVENNLTQTGSVMGTATYFSPEQAQGKPVDARSDLYSLGVVLYEMLVGKPPFKGDTPVTIAYKHVQEAPQTPLEVGVDVPVSLAAITMKLLAKNPANRYPSADDLRSDIGRYRSGAKLAADSAVVMPNDTPPTFVAPAPPGTQMMPAAGPGPQMPATQMMPQQGTQMMPQMQPGAQMHQPAYEPPGRDRPGFGALAFLFVVVGLAGVAISLLVYFNNQTSGPAGDPDATPVSAQFEVVPSVRNLPQDQAERDLETQGFVVVPEFQASEAVAPGLVISQTPAPSTELRKGDEVTITVSSGPAPVEVDSVEGIQVDDAERILRDSGFEVVINMVESDEEPLVGTVISQDPLGGEERPPGATVTLEVSSGPLSEELPRLVGLSLEDAEAILDERELEISLEEEESRDFEEGIVMETTPPEGTELKPGDTVEIVVSTGSPLVTVPQTLNLFEDDATQTLQDDGLFVDVVRIPTEDPGIVGLVGRQAPPPGAEVEQGSSVTIEVFELIAPTPTPVPTAAPTAIPTAIPTAVPATAVPTAIPPTAEPATAVPPTAAPAPTVEPTAGAGG